MSKKRKEYPYWSEKLKRWIFEDDRELFPEDYEEKVVFT